MTQFQNNAGTNDHNPGPDSVDESLAPEAGAQKTPHETQVTPTIATEPEGSVGTGLNPP